jgi:hypothetical protein
MSEGKLAHLEMLQTVIGRMASNSFLLKGWSVTVVSALFALAADKANIYFVYLAYFPIAMFWLLDGYFLKQERLFRALYDNVRVKPDAAIDFSMNTSLVSPAVSGWLSTCVSSTLITFHGTVLGSVILVMLILAHSL